MKADTIGQDRKKIIAGGGERRGLAAAVSARLVGSNSVPRVVFLGMLQSFSFNGGHGMAVLD